MISACLLSASYSILSGYQVTILFRILIDFVSFSPDPTQGKHVFDLDRQYVFHSWSAQGALNPMCIAAAEGSYVWDYDGNKWLDFSSQLVNVNIGHQHPKVIAAIQEQAGKLSTIAPQHLSLIHI